MTSGLGWPDRLAAMSPQKRYGNSRIDGLERRQGKRDLLFFSLVIENRSDENAKTVVGN